jgi:hypothetical protein
VSLMEKETCVFVGEALAQAPIITKTEGPVGLCRRRNEREQVFKFTRHRLSLHISILIRFIDVLLVCRTLLQISMRHPTRLAQHSKM